MKKLFAIIIATMMLLSLSSCGFVNIKGEEVELNYDTAKMQENLEKLRNEDGIYVELLITSYESGDKPVMSTMAYAETEDMFYFKGEESESYYDFTDDTKTVMYDKNEEGVWVRSEIVYSETGMTREQMETSCELQASSIFTYLDMYEQFNGQKMKKSTVEIAGRTCDEFNVSIGILGYGMSYVFAVDPETGMCLKWQISASAGMEGSASASFTCNKFESPYTIKLPTNYVNAEDVENNGGEDNGNNYGDNGDANNGSENNGNGSVSGTDGKISVFGNGTIFISDFYTSYNRNSGLGTISIEFEYANGEDVSFEEVWEMSAAEWGFTTTDTVCNLVDVSVYSGQNVIHVEFDGVTENDFVFGIKDITDIIYTPVAGKEIKTAQGEVIGGFTVNND